MKPSKIQTTLIIILILSLLSFGSIFIPPHKSYGAGILSLLIPLFFLIDIVCFFFLLFKKSYWAMAALVMVCLAWLVLADVFSLRRIGVDATPALRMVTYNVNKLSPVENPKFFARDRVALSRWVKDNDFDIVCLQEMAELDHKPFTLAGYHKVFSGKITEEYDQLGLFIFSRLPIVETGIIEFGASSFNRLLWADIVYGGDTLRLVNVHLKSYNFQNGSFLFNVNQLKLGVVGRSFQLKKTYEFIKRSPYPVILAGDFNETPFSYTYRKINALLTDSFSESGAGYDYTYKKIPVRIDYVFTSRRLSATNYMVLHQANWSDHLPVTVEIGWNRVP